jgi:hypothetical protein
MLTTVEAINGAMSFIGPKRTSERRPAMSAFGGKADLAESRRHVRF